VDHGDDPQAALDAARWRVEENGVVEVEPGLARVVQALRARGHDARVGTDPHGFGVGQMILHYEVEGGSALIGGSDGRGDGYASGP